MLFDISNVERQIKRIYNLRDVAKGDCKYPISGFDIKNVEQRALRKAKAVWKFITFDKPKFMSTIELKNRLIDKIQKSENEGLLGEAYRLLDLETEEMDIYKLSIEQNQAIAQARQQIKNGQFLSDEQANKEIDEWLSK